MAFFLGATLLMVMLDAGPGGDAIGTIEITDGKAEIAPVADERDARTQRLGLGRRIGNAALAVGESARVGGFLGMAFRLFLCGDLQLPGPKLGRENDAPHPQLELGRASCRARVCPYVKIT